MWFPSSKTCSACGNINRNLKRESMWTCPSCGTRHDRNLNAAINLRNLIMAPNRRRNGQGQEAVVLQQGDLQRPRDREAREWSGMRPRRGSGDHRKLIMPQGDAGMGEAGRRWFNKGRRLHAKADPAS